MSTVLPSNVAPQHRISKRQAPSVDWTLDTKHLEETYPMPRIALATAVTILTPTPLMMIDSLCRYNSYRRDKQHKRQSAWLLLVSGLYRHR